MREYDLIADWYPTDRGRTVGVAEALAVAATLPAGSRILDVGCGNGVPITVALANAGHRVVGLDTSTGMLARFRVNLPGTPHRTSHTTSCDWRYSSGADLMTASMLADELFWLAVGAQRCWKGAPE